MWSVICRIGRVGDGCASLGKQPQATAWTKPSAVSEGDTNRLRVALFTSPSAYALCSDRDAETAMRTKLFRYRDRRTYRVPSVSVRALFIKWMLQRCLALEFPAGDLLLPPIHEIKKVARWLRRRQRATSPLLRLQSTLPLPSTQPMILELTSK